MHGVQGEGTRGYGAIAIYLDENVGVEEIDIDHDSEDREAQEREDGAADEHRHATARRLQEGIGVRGG